MRVHFVWRVFGRQLSLCKRQMDPVQENNLNPPSRVVGMKVLDREMFTKVIKVHCYFFENKKAPTTLKILKPYLLKAPTLNPITEGHEKCCRVAYLDPVLVPNGFQDFKPEEQEALVNLGFSSETTLRDVTLTYQHFKTEQVLRAVIPPNLDNVTSHTQIGHIIHVNLRKELEEYKYVIGAVLLDKVFEFAVHNMDLNLLSILCFVL